MVGKSEENEAQDICWMYTESCAPIRRLGGCALSIQMGGWDCRVAYSAEAHDGSHEGECNSTPEGYSDVRDHAGPHLKSKRTDKVC